MYDPEAIRPVDSTLLFECMARALVLRLDLQHALCLTPEAIKAIDNTCLSSPSWLAFLPTNTVHRQIQKVLARFAPVLGEIIIVKAHSDLYSSGAPTLMNRCPST